MPFAEEQSDLGAREGTDAPGTTAYRAQAAKVKLSHRATSGSPCGAQATILATSGLGVRRKHGVLGKSLRDSCLCDAETQV